MSRAAACSRHDRDPDADGGQGTTERESTDASTGDGDDDSCGGCPQGQLCTGLYGHAGFGGWAVFSSDCWFVVGSDPSGSPCTSEAADPAAHGVDSCDASGICWNGSLTAEPFEGICQPMCTPTEPQCPDGMSCQEVAPEYQLCMPTP